ncbi:hypothetical protein JOB18_017831 [Solea senegalensis]|uniref:Uncharacterized protein n=1 Tax=Solea senegalensis TaxID=28829 RepID=A0AAV6PII7_SOLSE|nr:hypothetical protein JOB18_017831 [Solea senegalensis]
MMTTTPERRADNNRRRGGEVCTFGSGRVRTHGRRVRVWKSIRALERKESSCAHKHLDNRLLRHEKQLEKYGQNTTRRGAEKNKSLHGRRINGRHPQIVRKNVGCAAASYRGDTEQTSIPTEGKKEEGKEKIQWTCFLRFSQVKTRPFIRGDNVHPAALGLPLALYLPVSRNTRHILLSQKFTSCSSALLLHADLHSQDER